VEQAVRQDAEPVQLRVRGIRGMLHGS
jgi:hypothetical protein